MSRVPAAIVNEDLRVASVRSYDVIDSLSTREFDLITSLAARVCATPIALVTILDEANDVFISRVGTEAASAPRASSFCVHAAARPSELTVVSDVLADVRFRENPFVTGEPFVRFYAGIPLNSSDGFVLGALCVLDVVPRELDAAARATLVLAGRCVEALLEERRTSLRLARALAEGRAREARVALLESVAVNAHEGVMILEGAPEGALPIVAFANDSILRLTGWAPQALPQALDATLWAAVADRDGLDALAGMLARREPYSTEALVRRDDGYASLLQFSFSPVIDPSGELAQRWIVLVTDVTDRTRAEAVQLRADSILARNDELAAELERRRDVEDRLRFIAAHDSLTGLRNRAYFVERLRARLASARERPGEPSFAVMFLDIDRFKAINDTLGHMFGDDLLVALARRIVGCVRAQDIVSRLGGDEFTILVESVVDRASVASLADRIARAIAAPCRLGMSDVIVSASIGIVFDNGAYEAAEDMLRDADIAMFHAKARGRNRHESFHEGLRERVVGEARLEKALRVALETNEFYLAYQPIVALDDPTAPIVGFEALLRWDRPSPVEIEMGAIVAAAEESGLIAPLGAWVIRRAAREARSWHAALSAGARRPFVSVNVSPHQLLDPTFPEIVSHALEASELAPTDLGLELTGRSAMPDIDRIADTLRALRALGVRTSLDDFGTGFAQLSSVRLFSIDSLKIDRSFVADGSSLELADAAIVEGIVSLAHRLGLRVVAEGVETPEQMRALVELGCDFAQGFVCGAPMTGDAALELLIRNMKSSPSGK